MPLQGIGEGHARGGSSRDPEEARVGRSLATNLCASLPRSTRHGKACIGKEESLLSTFVLDGGSLIA